MTPASVNSVERDRIWGQNKEHKWNYNRKYLNMLIVYFWGLTSSQETKGHTVEEPGGHGRVARRRLHPDEALVGMNKGVGRPSSSQFHKVESGPTVILLSVTAHGTSFQRRALILCRRVTGLDCNYFRMCLAHSKHLPQLNPSRP